MLVLFFGGCGASFEGSEPLEPAPRPFVREPADTACSPTVLACGDRVEADTRCGTDRYDSAFYEANFCIPDWGLNDGGKERLYRLPTPAGATTAVVTLEPLESDLDVVALYAASTDPPDPVTHRPMRCDGQPMPQNEPEYLFLQSVEVSAWWVVVDGKGANEGRFRLSVDCWPGLDMPPGWGVGGDPPRFGKAP